MAGPLRTLRKRRNLTQEQLAEHAQVDQVTISCLENSDDPNPHWKTAYRISRALKTRPEVVFPVDDLPEAVRS